MVTVSAVSMPYRQNRKVGSRSHENLESPPSTQRAAKVGHKKSRWGCQRCKMRRVKCDESKPACGSCTRHGALCTYLEMKHSMTGGGEESKSRRRRSKVITWANSASPTTEPCSCSCSCSNTTVEDTEESESRATRMMELRLMQNNLMNILHGPLESTQDAEKWFPMQWRLLSTDNLNHDNLMYASFALSATHLLRSNPDDQTLYSARQKYLVLALREQRQACENISLRNAEAVFMTSFLILRCSIAMLQEQTSDASCSTEWLKMGRGAGAVMFKAEAAIPPSCATPECLQFFLDTLRFVSDEQEHALYLDSPFLELHARICEDRVDPEEREAFRKSLIYVDSMQKCIDRGKLDCTILQRLHAFPVIVPARFIDLVVQQDPFAMIVMAHFFGVVAQIDAKFWWLQGNSQTNESTASRQITAIHAQLTEDMKPFMLWPLTKI